MQGKEIWNREPVLATIPLMQFALLGIQALAFVGLAVATVAPDLRLKAIGALLVLAIGCGIGVAVAGVGDRTLEINHLFSAYVEMQVQSKEFVIETVTASRAVWLTICVGFCGFWVVVLRLSRDSARAFGVPLLLAWSGVALQLLLEKSAAPSILLSPFDLAPDRVLFPATLAGAYLLAKSGRKILHVFLYLSLFIAVTRLPLAVFGTLATRGEWGTHLDVHGTVFFVPPGGATTVGSIEVEAGGAEQLFWLIWAPHLIVYPFFYMMSTGGFAFLKMMWERQKEVDRAAATS